MTRFLLLLVMTILGAQAAYTIKCVLQYRAERKDLLDAADRQITRGFHLGTEALQAVDALKASHLPPCSVRDLALMRNLVFNSAHIRDAGRVEDGMILCSVGAGKLDPPVAVAPVDAVVNNFQLWVSTWPFTSTNHKGFVLQSQDVWVALNQELLEDVSDSADRYTASYLHDRRRMLPSSGPLPPLSIDEIVASQFLIRNGFMYQPLCVTRSAICATAAERIATFSARSQPELRLWTVIGGLIGVSATCGLYLLDSRRRTLEAQLRRAIQRDSFTLVYQPIVDLETEAVTGAETLVRWVNEAGDAVPPDTFIALAENKGIVGQITRLVIRGVIREMGAQLATGALHITINITSQDLLDPTFLPELNRLIDNAQIPRFTIGLELTERSTADHALVAEAIARLKEAGYDLYIDDFGTGYSSLAYLHTLSVDVIKIDRSFTQTVGTEAVTASVVPQILSMARQLGLLVVVEGIETREQAIYFRDSTAGIWGQGWLYSKPLIAADFHKLLQTAKSLAKL
ncbi:EAL domain-containing protein [Granulicella rosea]|nr:EAL domain-containing protein [Granulicella rosea]